MTPVDSLLEALKNGEWHGFKEVGNKTKLQEFTVEVITSFLAEYDFLELNRKEKKVRMSPELRHFLERIEGIDRDEALRSKRGKSVSVGSIKLS